MELSLIKLLREQVRLKKRRVRLDELERADRQKRDLETEVNRLKKFKPGTNCMSRLFEDCMKDAKVPMELWLRKLKPLLDGRSLAVLTDILSMAVNPEYHSVIDSMYNRLGFSWHNCTNIINCTKTVNESWNAYIRRCRFTLGIFVSSCADVPMAI